MFKRMLSNATANTIKRSPITAPVQVRLESGSIFTINSPESTLPAHYPIVQSAQSLRPVLATTSLTHLLPPIHSDPFCNSAPIQLSPTAIAQLQSLRSTRTRSSLAKQFGISERVVGMLGWSKDAKGREGERLVRARVEEEKERREGRWGWKKMIAREERRRRRMLW